MEASQCLEKGDCFLLLDLPAKLTIGLDTLALTADGKNFLGFRDIPPGAHLLWISEPGAISRCGYWFVTGQRGQVRVKTWDRYNEMLGDVAEQSLLQEKKARLGETYPKLMPHNYKGEDTQKPAPEAKRISSSEPDFTQNSLAIWNKLTSAITPTYLSHVTGKTDVAEWLLDTTHGASAGTNIPFLQQLNKSSTSSSTANSSQLNFLFQQDILDLQLLAGDASQSDSSSRIQAVLNSDSNSTRESDILAEFQFTFLTGLYLSNYSCLEQWWHLLLRIILQAHRLVMERPELVRDLLQVLHAQLVYNERYVDSAGEEERDNSALAGKGEAQASVLDTIPRNKSRLRRALGLYKRRLKEDLAEGKDGVTARQRELGKVFGELEAWFWRFGWDLKEDDTEERSKDEAEGKGKKSKEDRVREARERMMMEGGDDSDDEMGEYAPVIVELDENGREVGMINLHGD